MTTETDHTSRYGLAQYSQITFNHLVDAFGALRWLAVAIVATFVALGLAAALTFPFVNRANVNIYPLSDFEAERFKSDDLAKFLKIDAMLLQTVFIDVLRERKLLREVLVSEKAIVRRPSEPEEMFEARLNNATSRFMIIPPPPENARTSNRNWTIVYDTRDPDAGFKLLTILIDRANAQVRERLLARYERLEADFLRTNGQMQADLKTKRKNMLDDYDRSTQSRLARLDEDVGLMKALGQREGRVISQSDQALFSAQVAVVDANKLTFMPGFQQMEQQAAQIRSRTNKEYFIDGLLDVDRDIRVLEQDQTVRRARAAVERILANDPGFAAVNDDLLRSSFSDGQAKLMTLIAALAMGFGLSFFLIFRKAYRLARWREAG